jgi:hypothetical protein
MAESICILFQQEDKVLTLQSPAKVLQIYIEVRYVPQPLQESLWDIS